MVHTTYKNADDWGMVNMKFFYNNIFISCKPHHKTSMISTKSSKVCI